MFQVTLDGDENRGEDFDGREYDNDKVNSAWEVHIRKENGEQEGDKQDDEQDNDGEQDREQDDDEDNINDEEHDGEQENEEQDNKEQQKDEEQLVHEGRTSREKVRGQNKGDRAIDVLESRLQKVFAHEVRLNACRPQLC